MENMRLIGCRERAHVVQVALPRRLVSAALYDPPLLPMGDKAGDTPVEGERMPGRGRGRGVVELQEGNRSSSKTVKGRAARASFSTSHVVAVVGTHSQARERIDPFLPIGNDQIIEGKCHASAIAMPPLDELAKGIMKYL
ncbi:hypothetical protein PR048_013138 [Dryococelus australis]|uniref:Uncharacterized protein n=1 Tax=Dryococelus australis TaxID=614101 RepID=A0ABQ9HRC7_9NEOP|nr:hypothetical protein PR048_013138 [Dryococelus australis]